MKGMAPTVFFSPSVHYMCNGDPVFNIDRRYNMLFQLQLPDKEVNKTYLTEVVVKHHV